MSSMDRLKLHRDCREMEQCDAHLGGLIYDSLCKICDKKVYLYHHPDELIHNIQLHKNALVFPYYFGQDSRNRTGLIAAICESSGIHYIGADAFSNIVCQDKSLSKEIIRKAGLHVPEEVVIYSIDDIPLLKYMPLPVIAKPLNQGTSIGISKNNVVETYAEADILVKDLLVHYGAVVVERFYKGREVNLSLLGHNGNVIDWNAVYWDTEQNKGFLDDKIFSWEYKVLWECDMQMFDASELITKELLEKSRKIFKILHKTDMLRIDFRISKDDYCVIELTPDMHLGDDAEYAGGFMMKHKISYLEVIENIIQNCIDGYQYQLSNEP